ncbi:MAG: EAL domain-containing protein [Burkholderiaceae bacterium]
MSDNQQQNISQPGNDEAAARPSAWLPAGRFLSIILVAYLSCLAAQTLGFFRWDSLPLWPAAGVAFGFGWRFGSVWILPAALGVSAWAALQTQAPELVIGAALVTLAGPMASLAALRWFNDFKPTEYRLEAALRLLVSVTVVSSPLNATLATLALTTSNVLPDVHPLHFFLSWWLLDSLGTLLVSPAIVATRFGRQAENEVGPNWLDAGAISLTAMIVLAGLLASEVGEQAYAYSLILFFLPVVAWTSIRSSERMVAFTLIVCACLVLGARAIQLTSEHQAVPPMIEASLLVFIAMVLSVLLQSVAADRRIALERVRQQARQDMSTGLLNDRGLLAEFGERLVAPDRPDYGLIGLHVSNFDTLNDLCGAIAALRLEQSVASLLLKQPGCQVAARLSAGRYALLIKSDSLPDVRAVAREIYSNLNGQVFRTDNGSVRLQTCVGGLLIDKHASTDSEDCLVSLADAQAIAASVRDPQLFIEPLSQTIIDARRAHQNKIEYIRESIRTNRFEIHAQPIIDADTPDDKLAYEILIRLIEPGGGLIQPPEFLSLAVQAQMTPAMDRGVISQVFAWLAGHPDALARTHKCSINLSGLTMSDGMIAAFIREKRAEFNIPPEIIVFEITESEAIRNPGAASRLVDELKADGFGIALDDFGVGLATFEYLKRFPLDYLKIDGSFIRNLANSPIDEEIVMSTVRVARRLNIQTVAEHVQSQDVYELLQRLGVGHFQGEHLGGAVPIESLFEGWQHGTADPGVRGSSAAPAPPPRARQRV